MIHTGEILPELHVVRKSSFRRFSFRQNVLCKNSSLFETLFKLTCTRSSRIDCIFYSVNVIIFVIVIIVIRIVIRDDDSRLLPKRNNLI